MLALPAGLVTRLTAVPVSAAGGAAALTAPLLRQVALDLDTYQPASAARLSAAVMNLVTAAVAERGDQAGSVPAESREQTLLLRIHAFIDQHLGDAGLTPGLVAALAALPVSAIAARWGLPDAAHFSRHFRCTYGQPPAEYRRLRLLPPA